MEALGGDDEAEALLGVAYAARQCDELLAGGAPGIHFYALNRALGTRAVLERASRIPALGARTGAPASPPRRPHRVARCANSRSFATRASGSPTPTTARETATLVLVHGLLMNRHMYDRLGPELRRAGNSA